MTRILVIDDEEPILQAFRMAFDMKPGRYDVACVATGEEGIARMRTSDFDLVFIDLRLPGVDGMEVLRQARRLRPGADSVIITGYSTVQSAVEAMKSGAVDYIVKPFTVEELDEIVDRVERGRHRRLAEIEERRGVLRWSWALRAQHLLLVLTFFLLSLTGIPLLFPETFRGVFFFEDSSMLRGLMHRVSAVVLILLSAFHVGFVIVSEDGSRNLRAILPRIPGDLKEAWGRILYNLGLQAEPPRAGRYNFIEKFEYFGVVWGTFVMVASGLVLWFADAVLRVAPLWVVDTAKVVHRYEAILAILVVAIWHMYTVHLRPEVFPMSRVWWTGRISREEMLAEHPLEYEERTGRRARPGGEGGDDGKRQDPRGAAGGCVGREVRGRRVGRDRGGGRACGPGGGSRGGVRGLPRHPGRRGLRAVRPRPQECRLRDRGLPGVPRGRPGDRGRARHPAPRGLRAMPRGGPGAVVRERSRP